MQTNTLRSAIVIVGTALLLSAPAFGQEPRDRQTIVVDELVLRDGSRLYGTVEATTDTEVVFRTHAGAQVIVPLAEVARIRKQKGIVEHGEFWRGDPNRTRLFFAPTGEALGRGQVSLGVYNILLPFIQVGLTDRLSIGGGTPLFFGVGGIDRPFWLTPKFQVHRGDRSAASIGTLHLLGPAGESAGIAYGVGTFHRNEGSLTFGVGRTYSGFDGGGGVVMFGGESPGFAQHQAADRKLRVDVRRRDRLGRRTVLRRTPVVGSRDGRPDRRLGRFLGVCVGQLRLRVLIPRTHPSSKPRSLLISCSLALLVSGASNRASPGVGKRPAVPPPPRARSS